jgi:hypothetical protein
MAQQDNRDRERVEKNTAPFDISYFNSEKNSFLVLTTSFEKNRIIINEKTRIEEVGGKFPYQTGELNIRLTDRQGEKIGDYLMPDPMIVRSCDEKESKTVLLEQGTIQLPLPKNRNISVLELVRDKKTIDRVDISELLEKYFERDNNERD